MKIRTLTCLILSSIMFFLTVAVSSSFAAHVTIIKVTEIKALVKNHIETNMPWQQGCMQDRIPRQNIRPAHTGRKNQLQG